MTQQAVGPLDKLSSIWQAFSLINKNQKIRRNEAIHSMLVKSFNAILAFIFLLIIFLVRKKNSIKLLLHADHYTDLLCHKL